MRIAELSRRTGVSSASIKHYVREGLLPAGERIGYNQTAYDEHHVVRLRLIRALLDTGGLSVAAARDVLAAVDDVRAPVVQVMAVAQRSVSAPTTAPTRASLERVRALAADRGWCVDDDNPGVAQCAEVLDRFADIGRDDLAAMLERYAGPALEVARGDLDAVAAHPHDRDRMVETVAVGTALGDAMLQGLRRMAQEHLARASSPDARVSAASSDASTREPS